MKRSHKRLLFLFISLIVIMIAGGVGYMMARAEPRLVEPEPEQTAVEAGADDARIASGATVTWIYEYDMCRHEITEASQADKALIGLSFSQLRQKYPDARIVSFEPDAVVLEKQFYGYCPSHYILKKDGDKISVFRTKSGTDEQEKTREYNILFEDVPDDEKDMLSAGRVFASMPDLEDFVYNLIKQSE